MRRGRIERHGLVVERLGVLVHGREQRVAELHVGHVELDLPVIDRLRGAQTPLDGVGPGPRVERLVLPERGPGEADIGPGGDDAVDMTAQPSAGGREAELVAVAAGGAQIEAGGL